jgi:hypothetical protein
MNRKHSKNIALTALIIGLLIHPLSGQDLDSLLNRTSEATDGVVIESFKGSKVGNGQSTNLPGNGELQMFIGHRFGKVSGGFYEFFGLDQATMRLGFDYGFNDWLAAGFGRSTLEKTWDLYAKSRIVGQKSGGAPVNFTLYAAGSVNTLKNVYPSGNDGFSDRLSLTVQGLVSRKFRRFSLQLAPVYVHTFYDPRSSGSEHLFSAGMAASLRLTRFLDLTAEYYAAIVKPSYDITNPFTLGLDIVTGGHLFQLVFTNAQAMFEKGLLSNTNGKWTAGDIYFGFNLTRTFYMKK